MKRMALFVAASAAVSLAVAVTVGGASGAATPGKSGGHHDERVVGTWLLEATPTHDEPFQVMMTFSPGGGLVETESPTPGTALGSWESLGHRRVAVTFQRFEFDSEGEPAGRVVVRLEGSFAATSSADRSSST